MEFWFSEFHTPDVKHSIRVNKQLYSKQSDYQRIDIFETPEFGRVLTLDGNVMLTERDEFIYDEMIVHVPMAVHKEARDILVIGAGDGGVVRELTRYDRVERIDLVEMDPQVVEACRAYLPGNACRMDDRRVHIYFENALKFIRRPLRSVRGLVHPRVLRQLLQRPERGRHHGQSAGQPLLRRGCQRHAAQPQTHCFHLPHQPGVSGPHPHFCSGLLAVRLCQQEVPPHR